MSSTEFKSDEIFIPKQDSIDSNESLFYTIGVLGISDICEYSLTAIQNSFQIYEPEFSKVYTSTVSSSSPLIIRRHWSNEYIKIYFYSPDSKIIVKEGSEGSNGIIKAIEDLESKPAIQIDTKLGLANRYVPTKIIDSPGNSNFVAFYPGDSIPASVSIVVSHPRIPIKVTPVDPAVRAVLNKDEYILIEPFVNLGELNEFTITIGGISEHTSFTYNSK